MIVADAALFLAGHPGLSLWGVPAYASLTTLVIVLGHRVPAVAFVAALVLASLTASSYVLLLWTAYQAGHAITSRSGTVKLIGAALGCLAVRVTIGPVDRKTISALVLTRVVFAALPLLVGRYLAQHRRLVAALDENNRRLRRERELLAERERSRERLRIARDMHDSLGHRLSLVSVQAAALEVSGLPSPQRQAVLRLAGSARGAMNELHELVGTLRGTDDAETPGVEAIGDLVEEIRTVGMPVTLRGRGEPRRMPAAAGQAPGAPRGAGHGLAGLEERVRLAGGFLDRERSGGEHRRVAMLPVTVVETAEDDGLPAGTRGRAVVLGLTVALLMFVVLPVSMPAGVR